MKPAMALILKKVPFIIIGIFLGLTPIAGAATQYGAGSLLQIGDVQSKHVLDGTLMNSDISANARISVQKITATSTQGNIFLSDGTNIATSSNLKYATSTNNLYVFGGRLHATSTNFGGFNQTWPSTAGTNSYALTTDGAGTLSWSSPGAGALTYAGTAGGTITQGDAVSITSYYASTTFVGKIDRQRDASNTNLTFAYTIGAGSNHMLMCLVINNTNTTDEPTSVTYGGAAMSKLSSTGFASQRNLVYSLATTTAPTNNVSVTFSGLHDIMVECADYANVSQTVPTNVRVVTGSSVATITNQLSEHVATSSMDVLLGASDSGNLIAGTNAIARTSANFQQIFDNNAFVNTVGPYAMTVTATSGNISVTMVELTPVQVTSGVLVRANGTLNGGLDKNFLGFAASSVSAGQALTLTIKGLFSLASNIIPGAHYYLSDTAGAISVATSTTATKAGVGVTSTSLMVGSF